MASGIKGSCNRPKSAAQLKGNSQKKRHKNTSEAQKAYHEKINARRAKRKKRGGK